MIKIFCENNKIFSKSNQNLLKKIVNNFYWTPKTRNNNELIKNEKKKKKDKQNFPQLIINPQPPKVTIKKAIYNDTPNLLKLCQENFIKNIQNPSHKICANNEALQLIWLYLIEQNMSVIAIQNKFDNNNYYNYNINNKSKNKNKLTKLTRKTNVKNHENYTILGGAINAKILSWDRELLENLKNYVICEKTSEIFQLYLKIIQESYVFKKYDIQTICNLTHLIIDEENCQRYKIDKNIMAISLINKSIELADIRGFLYFNVICNENNKILIDAMKSIDGFELIWDKDSADETNLNNEQGQEGIKIFTKQLR